jgi:hypothetical protein
MYLEQLSQGSSFKSLARTSLSRSISSMVTASVACQPVQPFPRIISMFHGFETVERQDREFLHGKPGL